MAHDDADELSHERPPDREQAVEEMGRRAGAALRRPAPADGVARAMRSAQRRRSARVVAIAGLIALAGVVGLIISGSGDHRRPRPVTTVDESPAGAGDLSDSQVARAMLLTADEYVPSWILRDEGDVVGMSRQIAAGVPACGPFLDPAFESEGRPAATNYQRFSAVTPPVALSQYVVVLADDAAAHRMFAAVNDPAFLGGCVPGYWDALGQEAHSIFPFSRAVAVSPVATIVGGDEATMRAFESTRSGQQVGQPLKLSSAVVRVGRTVLVVETLDEDSLGRPVVTPARFRQIVDRMVERAGSALAGVALPPREPAPADGTASATGAFVTPAAGAAPLTVRLANVKWLARIEAIDHRYAGRFMARDYVTIREEQRGGQTVWTFATVGHARLKSAPARVTVADGRYRVGGAAWGAPIERVEVRVDGGSWIPATITSRDDGERSDSRKGHTWALWEFDWGSPAAGTHTIASRAIDVDGEVQPQPDDALLAAKRTFWESNGQISRQVKIP